MSSMPSKPRQTPDIRTSAPSPKAAQAAVMRQNGATTRQIAEALGFTTGESGMRHVRRLLSQAKAAGVALGAPEAAPAQDAATGQFAKKRPRGRGRVITLQDYGSHSEIRSSRVESREQHDLRTGGAGRGGLGRDAALGELNERGQMLVHSATIDVFPRRSALDYYREPPPGAARAILVMDDGRQIEVDL